MLSRWYILPAADQALPALQRLEAEHVLEALQDAGFLAADTTANQLIALDASYQPGEALRAAIAWLPRPEIPLHRVWAEGQIFSLRAPVRQPMSGRGKEGKLDGVPVELYALPKDRRLRELKQIIRREALTNLWEEWFDERVELRRTFLRFVPESKFVCHIRPASNDAEQSQATEGIALRVTRTKTAKRLAHRHRVCAEQVNDRPGSLHIPPLAAADPERGLIAIDWMSGLPLDEKLRKTKPKRIMSRLADAMQQFHAMAVNNLPELGPEQVLKKTNEYIAELTQALPEHRDELKGIASDMDHLARSIVPHPIRQTLHNDLNWAQVQIQNDRCTILDLECMAQGDPLIDIAHMDVCLELASVREDLSITPDESIHWRELWLQAWQQREPRRTTEPVFHFYRVCSAIRLARGMIRHLRPVWPAVVPAAIRCAKQCLSHASVPRGQR